jgi:hypothetical protein
MSASNPYKLDRRALLAGAASLVAAPAFSQIASLPTEIDATNPAEPVYVRNNI